MRLLNLAAVPSLSYVPYEPAADTDLIIIASLQRNSRVTSPRVSSADSQRVLKKRSPGAS